MSKTNINQPQFIRCANIYININHIVSIRPYDIKEASYPYKMKIGYTVYTTNNYYSSVELTENDNGYNEIKKLINVD